jgi:hypothetical protein
MTLETLFFVLLVAFVVLANVILPWLRRRLEAGMPREREPQAPEATRRAKVLPPRPAPAPGRPPAPSRPREGPIRAPLPAVAPPAAKRREARWPVASLRDARRGIVLMTLLGPCRAVEPYDPDGKPSP